LKPENNSRVAWVALEAPICGNTARYTRASKSRRSSCSSAGEPCCCAEIMKSVFLFIILRRTLIARATGCSAEVQFSAGTRFFSLFRSVQTASLAHPATGALSTKLKRQGHEADHSHLTSAEVKKGVNASSWLGTCLILWLG
jgi:hypothetical protein